MSGELAPATLVSVRLFARNRAELGPRAVRIPVARSGTPLEVATVDFPFGIGRDGAMSIPTVAACRNLIVGAAVQMGVFAYRENERLPPGPLLTQPDPDTIWPATLGGTLDDLLFYGRAYWLVLAFDGASSEQNPEGFPIRARWIPYGEVTPNVEQSRGAYSRLNSYTIEGREVPPRMVIRFDSSLPGVLAFGGATLAAVLDQEAAARRFASVELPAGVLVNEGTELGPDEAREQVDAFQSARQTNAVAFLQGVKYERTDVSAADLQLVEGRARADTDCARLFNVPVTLIDGSPTGGASAMLYANLGSNQALFVSSAVAPHLRTIESTLSLPAVTPRGQRVAFDVQTFLRSDPAGLADYVTALYSADLISRDEGRSILGIPSETSSTSNLEPGRV